MKKTIYSLGLGMLLCCGTAIAQVKSSTQAGKKLPAKIRMSKEQLKDKVKGGWAGQTIGVTFGWPTEFQYQGTFIQDYETITWREDYVNEAMTTFPGLYDDVYVDLTFVDVFEKKGMNATPADFGNAFAGAKYMLWHANQAGRYNLQQGIPATQSGHWLNNPHADDIDFQIEADFAGLMSPGMPNAATEICDRVGRIMNSGDGWYGGVFIANMYSLAFVSDDIPFIVREALKTIPAQSKFYQCVSDVIKWHAKYPNDWKKTWFELQTKWAEDIGCPSMVFHPLNIDAKLNSAYVALGLLYGGGDFTKTMEISTRAGQDSDCNPASAGGILGTIMGYNKIPEYWLAPLKKAEHRNFSFTEYSLEKVYATGFKHAVENIGKYNGKVDGDYVEIPYTTTKTVKFEENFSGHFPKGRKPLGVVITDKTSFTFDGIGFVLRGYARRKNDSTPHHVIQAALHIDGKEVEKVNLPTDYSLSRADLFWRYQLPKGKHEVQIVILNPTEGYDIVTNDILEYDNQPHNGMRK